MVPMQPPPAPSPEPGERRRLDHPPSDRYGSAAPGGDGDPDAASEPAADESPLPDRERVLRGIAVGLVGAAGAIGFVVGSVMRPLRGAAVLVAVGSVALGLVGIWLFAGIEG